MQPHQAWWMLGVGSLSIAVFHLLWKQRAISDAAKELSESDAASNDAEPNGRARRSRFKVRSDGERSRVLCVPNKQWYQKAIEDVRATDVVLEVGCQRTEVTEALCARAAKVVGIDIQRKTELSNSDVPNKKHYRSRTYEVGGLEFHLASPWDGRQLQQLGEFTVICMDLSVILGADLLTDGIALIRSLQQLQENSLRCVIVKSRTLSSHCRQYLNVASVLHHGGHTPMKGISSPSCPVLCSIGVSQYRQAIGCAVGTSSNVLEIGCHFGCTTALIRKATQGVVIGVDVSKKIVANARTKYPDVKFEVADAWNPAQLLAFEVAFDVVFLDVGGISGYDGVLESLTLIRVLQTVFQPTLKTIVVKSRCLQDHANRFICCDSD